MDFNFMKVLATQKGHEIKRVINFSFGMNPKDPKALTLALNATETALWILEYCPAEALVRFNCGVISALSDGLEQFEYRNTEGETK